MAVSYVKDLPMENVLLVDCLNLCMRWKPYKPNERVVEFADQFISTVMSLARSYDCGQVFLLADMKGSTYRREIWPEYKANRKAKAEEQTPEQKKQSEIFFRYYEKALEAASKKWDLLRYPGVEADDLAAYIVKKKHWYGIEQIWMISSDRDWDLLISDSVSRFSTVTRKEVTSFNWPHPVGIEEYISLKCLTGDPGDNCPGVPGVGPKRAAALIEEYGSAFDICEAIPLPGKAKYIQAINESKDIILRNYELMDLLTYCEEAIGQENLADLARVLISNNKREHKFQGQ